MTRVSVIVPVYEQWHLVPVLLEALARQTLPASQWECILVDNGSRNLPGDAGLPDNVRLEQCSTPGSYAARNHGLERAVGGLLAFTDADCRPEPGWLEGLVDALVRTGGERLIAGGITVVPVGDGPRTVPELYELALTMTQARYVKRGWAVTANLAVPRAVFDAVGGFDATRFSGGDSEFCRRAARAGFGLEYRADATVLHPARREWHQLVTKARRIKGAQVLAGTPGQRLVYLLRNLVPPVRAAWFVVRRRGFGAGEKLLIYGVALRLWLVGIAEVAAVLAGRTPERR